MKNIKTNRIPPKTTLEKPKHPFIQFSNSIRQFQMLTSFMKSCDEVPSSVLLLKFFIIARPAISYIGKRSVV